MINYNNPSVSFADSSLYTREPLGAPAPQQRNDKLKFAKEKPSP